MKQDPSTARFRGACFLAALVLLASTGWGPALSRMLGSRPAWSVCGQAMCLCQPLEPVCPLCPQGVSLGSCLGDQPDQPTPEPEIDPSRIALMPTGTGVILGLGSVTDSLLIGLFLLGSGVPVDAAAIAERAVPVPADWALPAGGPTDQPTPPPRA